MYRYTLRSPRLWGSRTLGENFRSTFLFALPSWQEGAGRLVDFGNTLTEYNRTPAGENPDRRALAQDWLTVGDRIRAALWWHGGENRDPASKLGL